MDTDTRVRGHACPPLSADTDMDTDMKYFETADMDADTDITNFEAADTDADTGITHFVITIFENFLILTKIIQLQSSIGFERIFQSTYTLMDPNST